MVRFSSPQVVRTQATIISARESLALADRLHRHPRGPANWVGSWGPIIETFQDMYLGTNHLGFLSTRLISRDASNQWGDWFLLGASDSTIRVDNNGFCLVFNDRNHTWVASS